MFYFDMRDDAATAKVWSDLLVDVQNAMHRGAYRRAVAWPRSGAASITCCPTQSSGRTAQRCGTSGEFVVPAMTYMLLTQG